MTETSEQSADFAEALIERTATDPGAPFEPDALEQITALRNEDRAAFENLREGLKQAGCRVTELDRAIRDENSDGVQDLQADITTNIAGTVNLFRTPDGVAFADLDINGHRETWPVRSKGFKAWLVREHYRATGEALSSEERNSALNLIEARAQFDAPETKVFIRVAGLDGKLYLDLCDTDWSAVDIDATGWGVKETPPVRFRRTSGMKPLPVPRPGGSIDTLRSFLNVKSDADFVLIVSWILAVLRDHGPYPVIVLSGEQGSAKSTFSAILRAMVDPNTAPLRALPRENRDLFIAANNGHVLAFDNVSGLSPWISDTLCRLATGGGFAVRQLYTDQDEVLFDATRPIILNGIEDFVTRPDLADRALILTLEPIPEERRRPEAKLWADFEAERPHILGALLNGVVHGLKMLPETTLEQLPRMADFALWATACETAFWPAGTFLSAYNSNRDNAVENVIEFDLVASAVRTLMLKQTEWTGTATALLDALAQSISDREVNSKTWPKNARALSNRLRRAQTFLRKIGIEIQYTKEGRARTRVISIKYSDLFTAADDNRKRASAPSASPAPQSNNNENNDLTSSPRRTDDGVADGQADDDFSDENETVYANPLKNNGKDAADAADADMYPQSGPKKTNEKGLN